MARSKKPSIQSLIRSDRGFADLARTYLVLSQDGRNSLIQLGHHIRRQDTEREAKLEEKYKKRLIALQKTANGDHDPD